MQYRTWLNHRINLEFSEEVVSQLISSSFGAVHDVGAPASPFIAPFDDFVPGDISIPRRSLLVGQSSSLPGDANQVPPGQAFDPQNASKNQDASQGGLRKEPIDTNDGRECYNRIGGSGVEGMNVYRFPQRSSDPTALTIL